MRANAPVYFDAHNGLWGFASYDAVLAAEKDAKTFSNAGGSRPVNPPLPMMIDMDDPAHLLRRKLVNSGFTRKRVMDKVPSIATLCDTLIDSVCERGECDFVRDIAAPLPMAVIGDMLGVLPEERGMLLKWSDDLVTGLSSHIDETSAQAMMEAFAGYTAFTMESIGKRRAEPTEDLFSILVNAEVEGQRMADDEIVMETLLILIGGDETTRHTLSGGTEQLLRHRDQWDALVANVDLLPGAIEEMLRWTSPVKNMCRTLTADTTFHGTELRKDEKIMLMFESANFDESVFGDPDNFRIDRKPNSHMAFGFGAHFCLGNQLAKTELRNLFRELLTRLKRVEFGEPDMLYSSFVHGVKRVPAFVQ